MTDDGRPLTYRLAKSGPDKAQWDKADDVKLSRLLDSATLHPIHAHEQPPDRRKDTTYYNPQIKEKIDEVTNVKTFRVRGTAGGDRIHYPGDVSARTADIELVKLLLNKVISEPNTRWMTLDITDFYLHSTLKRPEYIRIQRKFISDATLSKYNLADFLTNNSVLFRVDKGMYGLPQAGLLAKQELEEHLAAGGYHQSPTVPCLFVHDTNGVMFSLVVDDFGVTYTDPAGAEHLHQHLAQRYPLRANWTPKKYLGITIEFDYPSRTVSLSMPGYMSKVLQRFQRLLSSGPSQAASPSIYVPPIYGQSTQHTHVDLTTSLSAADTLEMQELVGCILFYARAIDSTMLPAVNHISSVQSQLTLYVQQMGQRLLAYGAAYPNNVLVYHASDMLLKLQSDCSYLSRPRAGSVVGGLGYLGSHSDPTTINGAVFTISSLLDVVVGSAAEGEYGSVYFNAKHAVWTRTMLAAIGYPQPPTQILCDNKCAVGLANDTLKVKRGKSIDMRFHWIRDRVRQGQFSVVWAPGEENLADFFTKALPVSRHQQLMKYLVHTPTPALSHFCSARGKSATAFRLRTSSLYASK
jgi:hypothetical protein